MIKQRVFAWTDTYDIYDEYGNPKYFVKTEFFNIGHHMHIYDMYDQEVGVIHQEIFHLLPVFEVEIGGRTIGRIQRRFSLFTPRYDIEYHGWQVQGDLFGWDYDVYDGSYCIAHIGKELFRWGDTYVIDIANPEDEILGLMLVLAIDAANCSKKTDEFLANGLGAQYNTGLDSLLVVSMGTGTSFVKVQASATAMPAIRTWWQRAT